MRLPHGKLSRFGWRQKITYEEGAILKASIAQPFPKESLLAQNFETFLLIAGNLDAIRDEYSRTGNREHANAKLELYFAHFALPVAAITAWKSIRDGRKGVGA